MLPCRDGLEEAKVRSELFKGGVRLLAVVNSSKQASVEETCVQEAGVVVVTRLACGKHYLGRGRGSRFAVFACRECEGLRGVVDELHGGLGLLELLLLLLGLLL